MRPMPDDKILGNLGATRRKTVESDEHVEIRPLGETGISLRKLQIFWAIAHSPTLTRAAKLLGVSQPSLSQQLTSLETTIGARLFDRRANSMELTEVGAAILVKAEQVLRSLQELEDGLPQAGAAMRRTVRIAGVTSAMRMLLPATLRELQKGPHDLDFDMHEAAPAEILELLYARRVNMGLLDANSVAEASAGFEQVPILTDPYVLVVPAGLDLSGVVDPVRDLQPADLALLNSTIQFVFGNQHSRRVQDWYDRVLPENRLTARARSFELVVELVRGGLGVGVVPMLSALNGAVHLDGVNLYRIDIEPRRIVALFPAHCRKQVPYAQLLAALLQAGAALTLPPLAAIPPFIAAAAEPAVSGGIGPGYGKDRLHTSVTDAKPLFTGIGPVV